MPAQGVWGRGYGRGFVRASGEISSGGWPIYGNWPASWPGSLRIFGYCGYPRSASMGRRALPPRLAWGDACPWFGSATAIRVAKLAVPWCCRGRSLLSGLGAVGALTLLSLAMSPGCVGSWLAGPWSAADPEPGAEGSGVSMVLSWLSICSQLFRATCSSSAAAARVLTCENVSGAEGI
jgi:hypothetical protein